MAKPLCCKCARLKDFKVGEYGRVIAHCEAYPNGIPEAVVYAGHLFPKPDDNGLQFVLENPDEYVRETTQRAENREYRELKAYYEELDMSDDEWVVMMMKTKKIPEEEARIFLDLRPRRETEPKKW